MKKISVIITTKDRSHLLSLCLKSLQAQTKAPDEIVVIDNSPTQSAKPIVLSFARLFPQTHYHIQVNRGIPYAKNMGIDVSRYEILAFLDDDCQADGNWIMQIHKSYSKNIDAVMGKSLNGYPHNVYSCNEYYITERSILIQLFNKAGTVYCKLVDPKNFSIKKSVLIKNSLRFDESFAPYAGCEELDFSKRLSQKKILVTYNGQMRVHHYGRANMVTHTLREFKKGRAIRFFYSKWRSIVEQEIAKRKSALMRLSKKEKMKVDSINREIRGMILKNRSIFFRYFFLFLDRYTYFVNKLGYLFEYHMQRVTGKRPI